jgi:hypothetical protein
MAGKANSGDEESPGVAKLLTEIGQKLIAALVSGAGLIGIVVLTGGAILWVRFRAAHLPPPPLPAKSTSSVRASVSRPLANWCLRETAQERTR